MKNILTILATILLSVNLIGQDISSISESRKENLRKVLDYRYKGGYYSFERLFYKMVEYPEIAVQNCVLGIIIASFEVNCEGEIVKITLKNMLRLGINEEITKFFNATEGQWNNCDDKKYTKFDIPIQFTLDGTDTNTTDALLVVENETLGFDCHDDEYYREKAEKLLEKGKGKKALPHIDKLIQRNPYNNNFYEMKKKALSLIK